jgi:hypothetical protein
MTEIEAIKERNRRVGLDKAWETSITRRTIIAFLTYVVAVTWLKIIGNETPFLSALVPCGGYIFSTWSLPVIKKWWIAKQHHD